MLPKLDVKLLKACDATVLDFFSTLDTEEKKKLTYSMERVRQGNAQTKHCSPVGDGIYEIRAMTPTRWLRLLGHIDKGTLWLTNGLAKDQDKLPRADIELAKRIRDCHLKS